MRVNPRRLRRLLPSVPLLATAVALASATPAQATEPCEAGMCVCGDAGPGVVDGVVEGRVVEIRSGHPYPEEARVEVVAVHGAAADHWSVGEVLPAPVFHDASSGLSEDEDVLVLMVGGGANFVQRLDASGAPICFGDPLPLSTAEAIDLALQENCRTTLETQFPDHQLEPPCPEVSGCATAGGGAGFLALALVGIRIRSARTADRRRATVRLGHAA